LKKPKSGNQIYFNNFFREIYLLLQLQNSTKSMFRQTQPKTITIRFRRWSRAGYAVFCSLSSTVTIGRLAVSIADKSLQKAVKVNTDFPFGISSEESPEEKKKKAELEASLVMIQETILSEISFDSAAAQGRKSNYLIFI
jgi:hypothetical protein